MKNKKLLAILLAVFSSFAVATTTLTACGGGDDSDPDTEQTGGSTDGDTSGGSSDGGSSGGSSDGSSSGSSTDGGSSGSETSHTHTYGDWVVTVLPTETTTGTATRTCTDSTCGDVQTVTLPALSDTSYTISDITATATEDGTAKYTITIGGVEYSFTVSVSATGTGGSGDEGDDTKTVAATGIALSRSTHYATIGYTCTLTATVTPSTATNKNVTWTSSDTSIATVDGGVVTGVAAGTATITATSEDGSYTASCTVTVREVSTTEIATPQDLNAFRALGELSGTYKLINDIDMSGVAMDDTAVILSSGASFDGQGYTISNATYAAGSSKVGILFKTITGGTVTNVKFLNCTITSSSESAAILAGECNGSATISKIEFNACTATVTGKDYAGLIFARREGSDDITINISEITAKNGCKVTCSTYGGLLVGDITSATNLVFKDLDVDGELESSGNFSFISGRTRGGTVSVENAVISAAITTSSTSVNYGLFSGNNSLSSLTIKNVLIVESNISNLYQSSKAPSSISVTNLVTVSGVTVDQSTASDGTATATYLKTLGFDFTDTWTEEGDDGYRLTAASTNVKSDDATITSLSLSTGNAETRIKKGGSFSTDGLSVTGVYSDGVQLLLSENEGYTVDHSAVNVDAAGTYTVTVTSKEDGSVVATYTVTVVEETGFVVYDEFVTTVYVASSTTEFDTANLVVKSVWSDGEEETLSSGTGGYTVDSTSYSMTTAGTYSVKITYGTYDYKTIAITVTSAAATVSENQVDVYVVSTQTDTVSVSSEGVYTFNTVKDAIDYLEACDYDDTVVKVVHIGAGEYEAKITTDLCNLTLIGENTDTEDDISVLTYSAVESTEDIVNGGTYGLDCATLQVNGTNLTIKNLTIRNDFDYINDAANESSPQGLALTIAGDKAIIENCHLYGNQDTLYLKNGRAYFTNTLIEGNVDFIFGQATGIAYFYQCEIRAISRFADGSEGSNNGYVTAMKADSSDKPDYGYIFDSCSFTDDGKVLSGSMSLGRPWGASATVAMINCSFSKAYSTAAYDGSTKSRWYEMSGNSPVNADFCEYGSTGEGAITEAVTGGKVLTETEAANYTIANIFAATNGNCTWSDSWDPTNTVTYLVTVTDGATTYATLSVSSGATLTADEVKAAVNAKLDSPYEVTGVYSDETCEVSYTSSEITSATTLYVKVEIGDLTITESVTYSVSNDDFSDIASGSTGYIGKLAVDGALTANNDWYIVGGSISATITAGATISVTVYSADSLAATVDGTAVTLTLGDDTTSGYVYSYTATADCTVVLAPASSTTLYVKVIDINVPVVYSIGDTIDLTAYTGEEINGTTGTWEGIYVDATNGKFKANGNSVQVNVGTILQIQSVAGATASITWYPSYGGTATITTDENGLITITVTAADNGTPYMVSITIVQGSTSGGDEGGDQSGDNDQDENATVESVEILGSTSVAVGSTINLTATVKMSDGTTSDTETVTWSSDDTTIATVDENGVVTGVAEGTVTITATLSSNGEVKLEFEIAVTASTGVTVSTVTISEANGTTEITVGDTLTLTATVTMSDDNYSYSGAVSWSSLDEDVATVNSSTGVVTAVSAGEVTITATADGEVTGTYTIKVTAASTVNYSNAEVNISSLVTAGTLSADSYTEETSLYSDDDTTISVTASSSSTVSIDGSEKLIDGYEFTYRLKLGGSGSSSARSIKVELAAGATITVYAMSSSSGSTRMLALYDSTYTALNTAQSDDGTEIAKYVYTVTESGTYYIASTSGGINVYGIIVDYSTIVDKDSLNNDDPSAVTLVAGSADNSTCTITGSVSYQMIKGDADDTTIVWYSSNTSIAIVAEDNDGNWVITAVKAGKATITPYVNGIAGSGTITVTVTVTATDAEITGSTDVEVDSTITLTAAVIMSDGSTADADSVSWSSGDTTIATVDENGVVTGVAEGEVTITATVTYGENTYTATYTVTVSEETSGGETDDDSGSTTTTIVAIFTSSDTSLASDAGFTVSGNYKSGNSFTYNGTEYSNPLKLESSTSVTFTTTETMTMTIGLYYSGTSYSIKVDGTTYTDDDGDGIIIIESLAKGDHTITKGTSDPNLCYVVLTSVSTSA